MAADDAFTVLEALERAERQEQPVAPDGSATDDESTDDDDLPEGAPA
jgi:hypothetical protein